MKTGAIVEPVGRIRNGRPGEQRVIGRTRDGQPAVTGLPYRRDEAGRTVIVCDGSEFGRKRIHCPESTTDTGSISIPLGPKLLVVVPQLCCDPVKVNGWHYLTPDDWAPIVAAKRGVAAARPLTVLPETNRRKISTAAPTEDEGTHHEPTEHSPAVQPGKLSRPASPAAPTGQPSAYWRAVRARRSSWNRGQLQLSAHRRQVSGAVRQRAGGSAGGPEGSALERGAQAGGRQPGDADAASAHPDNATDGRLGSV
jgi:hypothetical protein